MLLIMVASSSKRLREGVPLLYQGINILGESIARRHFEIGRILRLKSEIRNMGLDSNVGTSCQVAETVAAVYEGVNESQLHVAAAERRKNVAPGASPGIE